MAPPLGWPPDAPQNLFTVNAVKSIAAHTLVTVGCLPWQLQALFDALDAMQMSTQPSAYGVPCFGDCTPHHDDSANGRQCSGEESEP